LKSIIAILAPFAPITGGMTTLANYLSNSFKKNGHEVIHQHLGSGFKGLFLFPLLYFQFIKVIKKSDIIHIISASGNALWAKDLPAICISKYYKKKVILNFVGGRAIDDFSAWPLYKRLPFYLSDIVVVPSEVLKKVIERNNINVIKIPHMVEVVNFKKINKTVKINPPVLLIAKGIEKYSGHEKLIEIFSKIKEEIKNAELLIAGSGSREKDIKAKVEELKVENVTFLGNVDHNKMPKIMERSTILIHATKYESFGISLVEGMASSIPVIAFNIGGIPEVVIDQKTGFLIPYNDTQLFINKAIEILNNPIILSKMSGEAEKHSQIFSPDLIYNSWNDLHKKLIKNYFKKD
jgi:glycosyltransferase involved in cell wall biosynthesis